MRRARMAMPAMAPITMPAIAPPPSLDLLDGEFGVLGDFGLEESVDVVDDGRVAGRATSDGEALSA